MYDAVVCRLTFPSESYQDGYAITTAERRDFDFAEKRSWCISISNVGENLAAQIGLYWDIVCDTQPTKQ